MFKTFLKILVLLQISFAQVQAGGSFDLDRLYEEQLKVDYEKLKPAQKLAQKEKLIYIIFALIAFVVLLLFIKYYKLKGLFFAILLIAGGGYLLYQSSNKLRSYEEIFKTHIISPIAKGCCGYSYVSNSGLSREELQKSAVFAPAIDNFGSSDLYRGDGVKFSFMVATFKTKESASVERFNENRFEGFLIEIDKPNKEVGVAVSNSLIEKVANMDIEMKSFFSKGKRASRVGEWSIYGDVDQSKLDKIAKFSHKMVAFSFQKDKTYIALYHLSNPLKVDILKSFDLSRAKRYEKSFQEIEELIYSLR